MRIIPLAGAAGLGKFAVVDDADFDWALATPWPYQSRTRRKRTVGYAGARGKTMHRAIMARAGLSSRLVDHRNGWTLDNRRVNLRPLTTAERAHNTRRRSIHRFHKVWRVQLGTEMLGDFATEALAEAAHEAAALAAGYTTPTVRKALLQVMLDQLELWVAEGLLVRHIQDAPLIEDRYRIPKTKTTETAL